MENRIPTGLRFSILHRSFRRQMDAMLQEKNLTAVQFGVLGQLRRLEHSGEEEINQRSLEKATHLTHPTLTEIIKRLEKQGFVVCAPCQHDRRGKCIRSTDKAAALLQEMKALDDGVFRALCQGLTADEVEQLLAITDKMLKNAEPCEKKGREGLA